MLQGNVRFVLFFSCSLHCVVRLAQSRHAIVGPEDMMAALRRTASEKEKEMEKQDEELLKKIVFQVFAAAICTNCSVMKMVLSYILDLT